MGRAVLSLFAKRPDPGHRVDHTRPLHDRLCRCRACKPPLGRAA